MSALDDLKTRLAELHDLGGVAQLVEWDQQVMMPPGGAQARAHHLTTLGKVIHERATPPAIAEALDAIDPAALDDVDADVVRLARHDHEIARAVPAELAAERTLAGAEGYEAWAAARANDDFASYAPALERNVRLAREYAACFPDAPTPYDAHLDRFDSGLTADRVAVVLGPLRDELAPLVRGHEPTAPALKLTLEQQQAAVEAGLRSVGVDPARWRIDTSVHPFSTGIGEGDVRVTTRYAGDDVEPVLSALHEFGHGLYDSQLKAAVGRSTLADELSLSVHESQSKLWENHVCRSRGFAGLLAGAVDRLEQDALHAALNARSTTLIRVSADEVAYPLHIVLRFELERALCNGSLSVADLPAAWNDAVRDLLGLEVGSDADGVLQDPHWAAGEFGYFPTYAMGCLIAAQLWETIESDFGPQDDAMGAGEFGAIREWLGEKVHRHGRRLSTAQVVESATGRALDSEPFLRRARALA